jgi:hypothetical protein
MTPSHIDPLAAESLTLISRMRHLLDRYEQALTLPRIQQHANLDQVRRAVMAADHYLANGLRLGRIDAVPATTPEPPQSTQAAPAEHLVVDEGRLLMNRR